MTTCLLKRILPFMLTLVVGLGLGSIFHTSRGSRPQFTTQRSTERHYSCRTSSSRAVSTASETPASYSTPLEILSEPPTRMTKAARENGTFGVVQLEIEYGADRKARVLNRIKTQPDGLTEEAERVAELTRFEPATINGAPVSTTKVQSFYFHPGRY